VGNSEIVDIDVINRAPKLHTCTVHVPNLPTCSELCPTAVRDTRVELVRVGRWRVLTCCRWRNEAPVLIKSGAWFDKAETEMQRREETRHSRQMAVCVSKCFTTAVFCRVHEYRTIVPGGGQSSGVEGIAKKTGREMEEGSEEASSLLRLRRLAVHASLVRDRSMVAGVNSHGCWH
jgi:hypothetical protein